GLTPTGHDLIEEMMDLKFVIDTDHMSRLMIDDVLQMARTTTTERPNKYPLVSSHSSFQSQGSTSEFSVTDSTLDIFKEIGGIVTATDPKGACQTTSGFRANYLFAVQKMRKSDTDAYPGVAFSTDMNGFGG